MIRLTLVALALLSCLLGGVPAFAADDGKEMSIEDFLQQLSTVPGVVSRRDPFAEMDPLFGLSEAKKSDIDTADTNAPPLQRWPVNSYEVVAVLLGDQYPRALVRLPDPSHKVLIVKEGDRLGNHKGQIKKILLEGVVVQQATRSAHGFVDKSEVILRVGGKLDDQKMQVSSGPANSKVE